MGELTSGQQALLASRFPHFDAERSAALFKGGDDQVGQKDGHPCVALVNDVLWFPDRESRPTRKNTSDPMKSKAPTGLRRLLVHGGDAAELLLVEGEGHLVACASVGLSGVVCAGGTNGLAQKSDAAKADRKRVFDGKAVRILFDADPAGQKGRRVASKQLLAAGAGKVAYVDLPEDSGDVEDWLATFPSKETAFTALLQQLQGVEWRGADDPEDKEPKPCSTQFARVDDHLVVTVYNEATKQAKLAVLAPEELREYGDLPAEARGWALVDDWEYGETIYLPDFSDEVQTLLGTRALVLPPPPPESHGTSEALWADVRAFIDRNLVVPPGTLNVLVAFVFLSYRLHDAGFDATPYLRFWGAPATGKSWALRVMRQLCWRSYNTKPTSANFHRVVDYLGEITLVMDEFHITRGRPTEAQQALVDLLCNGFDRSATEVRCVPGSKGGDMKLQLFQLFGLRILSSYKEQLPEALQRRSVHIDMDAVELDPERMRPSPLPEFYTEAEALRGRLLSWRGDKLQLGKPDGDSLRAKQLYKEAGGSVAQVYWPLVEMVPEGMAEELQEILRHAIGTAGHVQDTQHSSVEAGMLAAVRDLVKDGQTTKRTGGVHFVTTAAVQALLSERGQDDWELADLGAKLSGLGMTRARRRSTPGTNPARGLEFKLDDENLARMMKRHGVKWPPTPPDTDEESGL